MSDDGRECSKGKESNPITITAAMAQGASGQVNKLGVAWQEEGSRNDPEAKRQGGGVSVESSPKSSRILHFTNIKRLRGDEYGHSIRQQGS